MALKHFCKCFILHVTTVLLLVANKHQNASNRTITFKPFSGIIHTHTRTASVSIWGRTVIDRLNRRAAKMSTQSTAGRAQHTLVSTDLEKKTVKDRSMQLWDIHKRRQVANKTRLRDLQTRRRQFGCQHVIAKTILDACNRSANQTFTEAGAKPDRRTDNSWRLKGNFYVARDNRLWRRGNEHASNGLRCGEDPLWLQALK